MFHFFHELLLDSTVEPPYNGHFGTSHFWSLLLSYRGFPLSEVKMYEHGTIGTAKLVLNREVFYIVSLIRRVL